MTVIKEEVLFSQGCFRHVRRWIAGWVPDIGGTFIQGYTGEETVVELDVVKPLHSFMVEDNEPQKPA